MINDLVDAVVALEGTVSQDEETGDWNVNSERMIFRAVTLAEDIATIAGVPLANVDKTIKGIASNTLNLIDGQNLGEYYYTKAFTDTSTSYSSLYDIMARAYLDGETENYDIMYDDMIGSGIEPDTVQDNILSRVKKSSSYIEAQQATYDELEAALESSASYGKLDDDQKAAALEDATQYAKVKAQQQLVDWYEIPSTYSWVEKAESFTNAGGSVEEYIVYRNLTKGLKSDVDEDGKAVSGSKREKVLAAINSLNVSSTAKDELYAAAGYAENSKDDVPWR
jgi:hypothetical protein